MAIENDDKIEKTRPGLYESLVQKITTWVKPHLHKTTEGFIDRAVDKYAKGNHRYARMISFEVRRRGDGPGITQDVAEPLVWIGIKTAAAGVIAVITESIKKSKEHGRNMLQMVGLSTAIGILLNNLVELFRLLPRYTAGLQGSLEMAKDRWESLEQNGVDPFNQQTREINPSSKSNANLSFAQSVEKKPAIAPTSLMEQASRPPESTSVSR